MAMKLIILLFLLHQFHAVASVILKGTPISTHPFGSKVKLTCVKEDGALVWTTSSSDILFIDEARYSKDEKYENFEVDISGNQSSMIITNALFEDEGEYSCSDANGKETILVKLEVAPRLRISYGGRQDPGPHLPSLSSPSISITCLAQGAKPEVSIRFKVGESDWLSPTNNEIAPRGVLYDTNATLNFQFIDDPNGNVVTCETSGQSSINPIAETQTLMTPNCILEVNNIEATCNCTSNPPVYKYIISTDGKMEVRKTINLEDLGGSSISCTGVNYIGAGTSKAIVVESATGSPFPVYVIIIVCLVVFILGAVIVLVVYYRCKKSKSKNNRKQGDHSQNDPSETQKLVDRDRKQGDQSQNDPSVTEKLVEKDRKQGDHSQNDPSVTEKLEEKDRKQGDHSQNDPSVTEKLEEKATKPEEAGVKNVNVRVSSQTTTSGTIIGVVKKEDNIDDSTETSEPNSKDERSKIPKNSTTGDSSEPSVYSSATKPVEAEVKKGNVRDMTKRWGKNASNDPPEKFHDDNVKKELAELLKGDKSDS
ncbi:uncharacterized protein [Apostichopus japonicus]|uniref:uncharacterized protein n=1 Tax=Stichopus japonicus TaxID=307972 RepID=UPI003AB27BA9